jgi:hypothetical protein
MIMDGCCLVRGGGPVASGRTSAFQSVCSFRLQPEFHSTSHRPSTSGIFAPLIKAPTSLCLVVLTIFVLHRQRTAVAVNCHQITHPLAAFAPRSGQDAGMRRDLITLDPRPERRNGRDVSKPHSGGRSACCRGPPAIQSYADCLIDALAMCLSHPSLRLISSCTSTATILERKLTNIHLTSWLQA